MSAFHAKSGAPCRGIDPGHGRSDDPVQASRVSRDRAIDGRSREGEIAEILIHDQALSASDEDDVGTTVVTDGQWHHVAVAFPEDGSPSAEDMLFYVDGVLDPSSASLPQAINTASGSDVRIGQDHSNRRFNGPIDEARICPEVRSADWIQACYSNQVQGSAFAQYDQVDVQRGFLLLVR